MSWLDIKKAITNMPYIKADCEEASLESVFPLYKETSSQGTAF